jgi:putative ABC transport system ATP-binding protein
VTSVLELSAIVKEYPGSPPVRALAGIDLGVDDGEFVAIVGPSGSGKSTLLNVVGILDPPTSGTVRIDGHDVARLRDHELSALRGRRIGFVFQTFNLVDGLDAEENVALSLLYAGLSRRDRRERSRAALERVGLGPRARHRPGQLSGGERQRVAIARALVGEPALVLADEPTGNLDTHTGATIVELFHRLHSEGTTILLITHDPGIAAGAPRCVAMRDGLIVDDTRRAA